MARDHRRLAAILSADVAGYSRLMERDESGTLAALKAHRRELIDPKITEYDGRIVKTTGDGLLLEFASVVDAVRCAVDMQRGMVVRSAGVPPDQRIAFRIGVNVGDIIIDDDDIFGDGVNVASRLQGLAEPGEICVSRAVRDQVLDKLSFAFEDLGAQQVKNIARPIEVYRIRDGGAGSGSVQSPSAVTPGARAGLRPRIVSWWWWAAGAAGLGLIGIVALQLPRWTQAVAAPPAFSVAVMPFVAATGNPGEEQLANALSENVVALMGKSKLLRVASARKVLGYKGKEVDARIIGRELNVRYLVDGEVRSSGSKMAITLHLVDAESGTQVWSDRLDTDAATSPEQDGATATRVRELLGGALYEKESRRAIAHPLPGSAVDLYLQGWAAQRAAISPDQIKAARKYYDDALRIDPDFVPALLNLAGLLDYLMFEDLDSDRSTFAQRIDEQDKLTTRALRIDDAYSSSWYARANALSWLERWDQALAANAKARSLATGPDTALVAQEGFILLSLDRPEEALALGQRSTAMTPASNTGQEGFSRRLLCWSNLLLGRYQDAVVACEKAAASDGWWLDQAYLAAGYAQLGDSPKAAAARSALLNKRPEFTIAKYKATNLGTAGYQQRAETHVYAGLRMAGLPEK